MLARTWGCTVAEAQARCSSREFTEWMAFLSLDCFADPAMAAWMTSSQKHRRAEDYFVWLPNRRPTTAGRDLVALQMHSWLKTQKHVVRRPPR